MATIAIELCDVGFLAAASDQQEPRLFDVPDRNGSIEWPGFCYAEGTNLSFGRAAEDLWMVHPRRVAHNFWARLNHEPSAVVPAGKPASFSELSFFFLREYWARLSAASPQPLQQVVLALPGAYLKDPGTEEEKVGLLLGMASELKMPLSGLIDMSCASLCDPRAAGFNQSLGIVVVDVHLEGAEVTLFTTDGRLERKDYIQFPQLGYAQLLRQLTGTMGNRFLRHTAFDILEDGRIEQTFFRQTKEFLEAETTEHRFHINTATRAYEMVAKREQLVADATTFVGSLVHGVQSFVRNSPHASEPCTVALTDRAARLPGFQAKLRAAGFARLLRLPRGAAAAGAARIGAQRFTTPADIADVPLETSVPLTDTRRLVAVQWDAKLQKNREPGPRLAPTHAILGGIGHAIGRNARFTIGMADLGADVPLPASFTAANDCSVPLINEAGKLWFVDPVGAGGEAAVARTPIEAGDRLTVRCESASAEILFAHCPATNGTRMD